jgi:hypothetical protein
MYRLDKMWQRAAEAVEFPDHQRVAGPTGVEGRSQSRPVHLGAADRVSEQALTPGGVERISLQIEMLVSGRYSGVANQHGDDPSVCICTMKLNACGVFCHGDFVDQLCGTLVGVGSGTIGVGMNRLGGAKQTDVFLHTTNQLPYAGVRESMNAAKQQATVTVYQLKVSLRHISPLIWRRLLVTSDTTIAQLHAIVQIAMGWEDLHLHQFRIHGKTYGIDRDGGISFADDPYQVILADFKLRTGERFVYEYDMGDCWQHDLRLEAVLPLEPRKHYPVCTASAGDCPPEDCGGPWGYLDLMAERDSGMALLEALDDQTLIAQRLLDWYDGGPRPTYDDTEYMDALERMRDWLADAPIPFDRRAVNAALRSQRKESPCISASN